MKKIVLACLLAAAGSAAHANAISTPLSIPTGGAAYFAFDFSDGPNDLTLATSGSTLDPVLYLFRETVSLGTFVASNDDADLSNKVLESFLTGVATSGRYVAAIGHFSFTLEEAVSGINVGGRDFTTTLTVSSRRGTVAAATLPPVTSVPEPGTLALLGAGLAALGFARRRRPA